VSEGREIITPLLRLEGVSRFFGGVQAVGGVSLSIEAGSIHGLIGPNGAGKTTALNLISGILRPDEGTISFRSRAISGLSAQRIARFGIRRTYQNIRLFGTLSCRENVLVGLHSRRRDSLLQRLYFAPSERRAEEWSRQQATALLDRVGIASRADVPAAQLPYGEQRRLEIARALAGAPELLLLDEPTAGMNPAEAHEIARLIRSIAAEGTAVLLVEHNLELVMGISHTITVLNFGRVIASGLPEAVRSDEDVIAAYIGTDE
jgi:ABC-type branched-subunit amino acid transport system ATPase component